MIALHLHPIHNALAIRYHPLGWHGRYAIQAMTLENGRWIAVNEPAHFDRDLLETPPNGEPLVNGQFHLSVDEGKWWIRHRGGLFGTCKVEAMAIALDKARVKATDRGEARERIETAIVSPTETDSESPATAS